ncbi:hypothetical protein Bbelb_374140 [Branchiostoma belcheri]|nr:hypothetical protein Bbelb_374140 [Branchiostoma belcheri]
MDRVNRGEIIPKQYPQEPTGPGENEENVRSDQNVLYTESTARMSTCGQNSPSSQVQDMSEVTYAGGIKDNRTTTNEHYCMADNNDDTPTPEVADVYFVSDTTHAENSVIYPVRGENEDDGDAIGNSKEETQVKQAGSAVTMNFNSSRKSNKSQPDTTGDYGNNKTTYRQGNIFNDGDIEPYAVSDIEEVAKSDSSVTDDGDFEPYAVTNMIDNETYLSGTTDVRQQPPDTSEHVHKLRNPPNAKKIHPNPMYSSNSQQACQLDVLVPNGSVPELKPPQRKSQLWISSAMKG